MVPVTEGVIQENQLNDEEYVIYRAKCSQKLDDATAKAWMITAKTLFPRNFAVQVLNHNLKHNTYISNLNDELLLILFSSLRHILPKKQRKILKKLLVISPPCMKINSPKNINKLLSTVWQYSEY